MNVQATNQGNRAAVAPLVTGWIIASAPIWGLIPEHIVNAFFPLAGLAAFGVWFVINSIACYADLQTLEGAGFDTQELEWCWFLVPVYLFRRRKIRRPGLLLLWIVALIVSAALDAGFNEGIKGVKTTMATTPGVQQSQISENKVQDQATTDPELQVAQTLAHLEESGARIEVEKEMLELRDVIETVQKNAPKVHPSFDCGKASTPTEHTICDNENLAAADLDIADYYKKGLVNPKADVPLLKQQQHAFIVKRNACGSDVDCLSGTMGARQQDLRMLFFTGSQDDHLRLVLSN